MLGKILILPKFNLFKTFRYKYFIMYEGRKQIKRVFLNIEFCLHLQKNLKRDQERSREINYLELPLFSIVN